MSLEMSFLAARSRSLGFCFLAHGIDQNCEYGEATRKYLTEVNSSPRQGKVSLSFQAIFFQI